MRLRFAVTLEHHRDYVVVAPVGELDVATAPELQAQLRTALDRPETPALDLRRVTFMDSSGVKTLLWADRESRTRGRRMQVVAAACALPVLEVWDDRRSFSWMSAEQLGPE
jgi:anti-anti-sigma factor